MWNADDGHSLATLGDHTGTILDASFSSDGKRIVTAGPGGTARVYIANSNELLKWAEKQLPKEAGK